MSNRERARDLGVTIGTLPTGPSNTLTDVPGVRVGHATLVEGDNVRTGVTAIWPHDGNPMTERVYAGISVLNGYGEMTCRSVIEENGLLASPIVLTGTGSVGAALHATTRYLANRYPQLVRDEVPIPLVAECDDGFLHDHLTFAVGEQEVWAALDGASADPVEEGCVGSGTGMTLFQFKGGIGSASRVLATEAGTFTVGVLVMTNFGRRPQLIVAGIPAGQSFTDLMPEDPTPDGSCIVVVGTDAPIAPHTLRRVAKRAGMGLVRTGSTGRDGSGEIMLAFSTAQRLPSKVPAGKLEISVLAEGGYNTRALNMLFDAMVEATEEAVINALVAATTTTGRGGRVLHAIPHDRLRALLLSPPRSDG